MSRPAGHDRLRRGGCRAACLAIGLTLGQPAASAAPVPGAAPAEAGAAFRIPDSRFESPAPPATTASASAQALQRAGASPDTRQVALWVIGSDDARGLPFVIVDKIGATVFAFSAAGMLIGHAPALLGRAHGDISPPGIGTRKLADIAAQDRITPSGRFVAGLGPDLGTTDVLWVDYDAAISLHRVFTGNVAEHRLARLATPSPDDNRISYGCINVPVAFYDAIIHPLFVGTQGIVYVLPDTRALTAVFPASVGAAGGGDAG